MAEDIERLILEGSYPPETRLPAEQELANTYGVSRNVVREALKSLKENGLVFIRTGSGSFVRRPTAKPVSEAIHRFIRHSANGITCTQLFEARRIIEPDFAHLAAQRATDDDLEKILAALTAMEDTHPNPALTSQADVDFHLSIAAAAHVLGTDHLGRDLLSRLIFGTRVALGTAFPAVLGALVGGLLLGLIAGYTGGNVDNAILLLTDSMQAFPAVILALALLALLGPSTTNVILVIVIAFMPGYARVARAQVLSVKQNPYIEVERSLGASNLRIIFVHILPNILAPLVILLAMDLPSAITFEAGLSFLGLGVRPPTPSWGVILADGFSKIRNSPWPVLWAGLALMTTTLGFTLFGETLRDLLDPKLAGSRRA